jgi:hypothetical protein
MFGIVALIDRILLSWQYKKIEEYEDISSFNKLAKE